MLKIFQAHMSILFSLWEVLEDIKSTVRKCVVSWGFHSPLSISWQPPAVLHAPNTSIEQMRNVDCSFIKATAGHMIFSCHFFLQKMTANFC